MRSELRQSHYIEIAVQSVLFNYKDQLEHIAQRNNIDLVQEMARKITQKASELQNISEQVALEIEKTS